MKTLLLNIRKPSKELKISIKIRNTILILLLGILLGILSKWLDNMALEDTIWWQHFLGILDLRNVFSEFGIWLLLALIISINSTTSLRASLNVFLFFLGMLISYHLYTIFFSGFNPKNYMMIWYGITGISPILAFFCWYGKGESKYSLLIASLIISIMILNCFSIGILYFAFRSIIYTLIFVGTLIVLYQKPKITGITLGIGLGIAYILKIFI